MFFGFFFSFSYHLTVGKYSKKNCESLIFCKSEVEWKMLIFCKGEVEWKMPNLNFFFTISIESFVIREML